jgi:parvulin-like peptidyl-prolyl isomerase
MMMRKKYFLLAMIFGSVASSLFAGEVLLDRICALVDSEPILLNEIRDKVEHGPLKKISIYPSTLSSSESDFNRALNDSINLRLVKRKAEELEIQVKDEQVEGYINQILSEMKTTREGLKRYLAEQNKDYEDYKRDIHDRILSQRFIGRVIIPMVKISEKDLEQYFQEKQGFSSDAAEVSLQRIVIPVENSVMASEKRKLAFEIYEKLKSGLSFEEAQNLYAPSQSHQQFVFQIRDLEKDIYPAIKDLKKGEVTKPTRRSEGFVLFYVADKRYLASEEFHRQKAALEKELHSREVEHQIDLWLQGERNRAKISIIKD